MPNNYIKEIKAFLELKEKLNCMAIIVVSMSKSKGAQVPFTSSPEACF